MVVQVVVGVVRVAVVGTRTLKPADEFREVAKLLLLVPLPLVALGQLVAFVLEAGEHRFPNRPQVPKKRFKFAVVAVRVAIA